jgi:hypothetical protein
MAESFVYLACDPAQSILKIGTSVQPHLRVHGLEFSAWLRFNKKYGKFRILALVPGGKTEESWFLSQFDNLRLGGKRREWLSYDPKVKRFFMQKGAAEPVKRVARKPGRPPVMTPCGWCGKPFAVAAKREHEPKCPKRPDSSLER